MHASANLPDRVPLTPPIVSASRLLFREGRKDHDISSPMPPKRACDTCIVRKVKCNGSWPCSTCQYAIKRVPCTYLRPVGKRGRKARQLVLEDQHRSQDRQPEVDPSQGLPVIHSEHNRTRVDENILQHTEGVSPLDSSLPHRISKAILVPILRLYQQFSYSVWPVINASILLEKLDHIEFESTQHDSETVACLVTALCAATMAQLHLAPVADGHRMVDSTAMAQACLRIKQNCGKYREHPDINSVLVSFFLHVYYAKVNQSTSAMMYIQEAISKAQILQLDKPSFPQEQCLDLGSGTDFIANKKLVFPLLWVSERGYALHLGLSPSYINPPLLAHLEDDPAADIHVQGLLDLVNLFIAFEKISLCRRSHTGFMSPTDLAATEDRLTSLHPKPMNHVSIRMADCHITREWMRTILWQEALSCGLLSSSACLDLLTFGFPTRVGRDLLHSLRSFSEADLLPLGRDQLMKCFEVANSLADTILLASAGSHNAFELGPPDFLHALYQKLAPFLEQDSRLKSMLRNKTAEVLVMAPARLLTMPLAGCGSTARVTDPVLEAANSQWSEIQQQSDYNSETGTSISHPVLVGKNV